MVNKINPRVYLDLLKGIILCIVPCSGLFSSLLKYCKRCRCWILQQKQCVTPFPFLRRYSHAWVLLMLVGWRRFPRVQRNLVVQELQKTQQSLRLTWLSGTRPRANPAVTAGCACESVEWRAARRSAALWKGGRHDLLEFSLVLHLSARLRIF